MVSDKQHGFSDDDLSTAAKQTKLQTFLSGIEALVLWLALITLIETVTRNQAKQSAGLPDIPEEKVFDLVKMAEAHICFNA